MAGTFLLIIYFISLWFYVFLSPFLCIFFNCQFLCIENGKVGGSLVWVLQRFVVMSQSLSGPLGAPVSLCLALVISPISHTCFHQYLNPNFAQTCCQIALASCCTFQWYSLAWLPVVDPVCFWPACFSSAPVNHLAFLSILSWPAPCLGFCLPGFLTSDLLPFALYTRKGYYPVALFRAILPVGTLTSLLPVVRVCPSFIVWTVFLI